MVVKGFQVPFKTYFYLNLNNFKVTIISIILSKNINLNTTFKSIIIITTFRKCSRKVYEKVIIFCESNFQAIVTLANVCVMIFVIVASNIIGFQIGWLGYDLTNGYFPYGLNGVLGGATIVLFSYIGFDAVASTAEEVKNPQHDLPLCIGIALSICGGLYMLVSVVIVGIVPYYLMDPDTPMSSSFSGHGLHWEMYIITTGAVAILSSRLMGSILPQPKILMAMARDGLLPSFFSEINRTTLVPINSTLLTGCVTAIMSFSMDVSQLAGMVSVGTLLSFTIVVVSILILRYVPPDGVPI